MQHPSLSAAAPQQAAIQGSPTDWFTHPPHERARMADAILTELSSDQTRIRTGSREWEALCHARGALGPALQRTTSILLTPVLLEELQMAHTLIQLMLNELHGDARTRFLCKAEEAGVSGEGATRYYERSTVLKEASGKVSKPAGNALLLKLAHDVAHLNPSAGEIGVGMLVQLVTNAKRALAVQGVTA